MEQWHVKILRQEWLKNRTVVALAIAVMVGDGCCAFVSMALGRNDELLL